MSHHDQRAKETGALAAVETETNRSKMTKSAMETLICVSHPQRTEVQRKLEEGLSVLRSKKGKANT